MKRMLSFLIALSSLLSVSCTKEAEFPPKPSFQVDAGQASEYNLNEKGKTLSYTFTPQKDWTVSVSGDAADWCTVTPAGGAAGKEATITITVAPNPNTNFRKAVITIKTADDASSRKITVTQKGQAEEGTISILAIGNSFSDDAMEYLYQILENAGYTSIKLGNLYIGGCTLETHAANLASGAKEYQYRVNVDGKWATTDKYSSVDALKSEDWDYISMQQASGWSGVPGSYDPHLAKLLEGVRALCPYSKFVWHMTWAYQQNSTHSDFSKYDKDQMKMYDAIVSTVKSTILPTEAFETIVPSGTVMQNIRTSFIGDTVTRDGYHLNYSVGRYAAALIWAKQIAGVDVDTVTWTPEGQFYTTGQLNAIKEAVNNAFEKPFEVTESTFKEDDLVKMTLEEIMAAGGYAPEDYTRLSFDLIFPGYYNSSSGTPVKVETGWAKFATTRIFEKAELPVGTLIVQKPGHGYRPEGWTAMGAQNAGADRPGNVSALLAEVDDAWWGNFNFRAFNLFKDGTDDLTSILDEIKGGFGIFVPNGAVVPSEPTLESILKDAGYDLSGYDKLSFDLVQPGYYNSSASDIPMTIQTNLAQFATTRVFKKDEFPAGTLIVQKEGFQYRPEGWTAENTPNAGADRPGNVSARIVVVDDAWWGSFTLRAFNIQKTGVGNLADIMDEVRGAFGIFVPKAAATTSELDKILAAEGYKVSDYKALSFDLIFPGFYNSSSGTPMKVETGWAKFATTRIFEKAELPAGTLLVQLQGYGYRPEGWTAKDVKNEGAARPGNVSAQIVEVDDAWWGNFNFRAFNLFKDGTDDLTSIIDEVKGAFGIYVPAK